MKETVTLHKVLSRYLPSSVVEVRVSHWHYVSIQKLMRFVNVVCDDASLCRYQPSTIGGVQ